LTPAITLMPRRKVETAQELARGESAFLKFLRSSPQVLDK